MEIQVVWSPEATDDLESIYDYIAKDSKFYAHSVVSKILKISCDIGNFPLMGRVVPEMDNESIRERFAYSYRIIYKLEKKTILIVAVIHGKRLFENISERF